MDDSSRSRSPWLAYAVMVVSPLFFASNLIFGKMTVPEVAPFTLAFLRWTGCAILLLPFVWSARGETLRLVRNHTGLWLTLGFLGMWVCGALVYVALSMTSATNGTLIYTTSPIYIILIERVFRGRAIAARELIGIVIAFAGVAVIVMKGDLAALLALQFNTGDLVFIGAAIAWAVYSVLFRSPTVTRIPAMGLFGVVCIAGSILLAPFALYELLTGADMPVTHSAWTGIAGIVFFASLIAFSGFQFGVRRLGAPLAGVFMYLLPPYGVILASLMLGEQFHDYHAIGIVLVLGGIVLATAPLGLLRRRRATA